MKEKPSSQPECQLVGVRSIGLFDLYLIQGALDTLGVSLADRYHQWTDGERAIYEEATEIIRASVGGCMGTDSLASEIFLSPRQWREWPLHSFQSYVQSALLGYSPWRVLLLLGRLLASTLVRCFLVFCSCLVVGEWRERLISLSNVPDDQSMLASGAGDAGNTASKGRESK